MLPNPQFPEHLVTFIEEILDGKRHFLCSVSLGRVALSNKSLSLAHNVQIYSVKYMILL